MMGWAMMGWNLPSRGSAGIRIRCTKYGKYALLALVLVWPLCSSIAQAEPDPESSGVPVRKSTISAEKMMAVTAHPYATQTAYDIIEQGGNALDAAIAAQLVLSTVEPQSSGLGGGGFMLYYDAKTKTLHSFDGRETAPASARSNRFLGSDGNAMDFYQAAKSGLSVGVPGMLHMLYTSHETYGRLPWKNLFARAIYLAHEGFRVSPRLAQLLKEGVEHNPDASFAALFQHADATPLKEGEKLVNPALAETFRTLANDGIKPFYDGAIAAHTVQALADRSPTATMKREDFSGYRSKEREPVCGNYRGYKICSVAPSLFRRYRHFTGAGNARRTRSKQICAL